MVGGCCGTTPQHVRAMREALDRLAPQRSAARVEPVRRARVDNARPETLDFQPPWAEKRLRDLAAAHEIETTAIGNAPRSRQTKWST